MMAGDVPTMVHPHGMPTSTRHSHTKPHASLAAY
jgi:hypothetical protein